MKTLDQTVKDGIKVLERSAEKKIRKPIKNDTLRMWKGRKVISLSKWEKIESDLGVVFDYVPDGFIDEYSMIYNWRLGEKFDKDRAEWLKDYFGYLEFKKNSEYGKYRCSNCIQNPFSKTKTTSIRDILVKHFVDSEILFPCEVVNIFECPYGQGSKDYALFFLGRIWKIVDDALAYAHSKCTYDNKRFIEADFEKNIARDNYSWSPTRFSFGPIAREIGDLRLSQVSVEMIKDIFAVLTNREKLDLLLEQYIESVADDYAYSGKRNESSEREAGQIRKIKIVCNQ